MIIDEKKALLIARYLIENSSEKFLELDFDSTAPLTQVKAKFKKLVGNVRQYLDFEERDLKTNLSSVFLNFYLNTFLDTFLLNL